MLQFLFAVIMGIIPATAFHGIVPCVASTSSAYRMATVTGFGNALQLNI